MLTRSQDRSLTCMWNEMAEIQRNSREATLRRSLVMAGLGKPWADLITVDQAEAVLAVLAQAPSS